MVLGLAGLASDVLRSDKLFVNRKYTQLISYHIAMSSKIRAYYIYLTYLSSWLRVRVDFLMRRFLDTCNM